ncbi:hypothetical protein ACWGJ2_09475 [Streptomyces sp. NPDC054796]
MAPITQILAHVHTADVGGADTGAWVYLGIGGREFVVDSTGADFTVGAKQDFRFGDGNNLEEPEYNDPRTPPLDTDDLDYFPVYLRFEPAGSNPPWCVEWVKVTVNPESGRALSYVHPSLEGETDRNRIWLDDSYGKALYLRPEHPFTPTTRSVK